MTLPTLVCNHEQVKRMGHWFSFRLDCLLPAQDGCLGGCFAPCMPGPEDDDEDRVMYSPDK